MSKKFLQTSGLALGLGLLLAGAAPINNAKADLVVHVPPEYFNLKRHSLYAGPVRVYDENIKVDKDKLSVNLTEKYPGLTQVWNSPWGDPKKDFSYVSMVLVPQVPHGANHQEVTVHMDKWPAYPEGTTVGEVLNNSTLLLTYDNGKYALALQPQAQK